MSTVAMFDIGGVVIDRTTGVNEGLRAELNISWDELYSLLSEHSAALGRGEIDQSVIWEAAVDRFGALYTQDDDLLGRELKRDLVVRDGVLNAIYEMNIVKAALSNTNLPHAIALQDIGVYEPFDHLLLSHQVGLLKPDPEIFELALNRFRVDPQEAIFIDDSEENCTAAEKLGIRAVVAVTECEVIRVISSI